MPSSDSVDSPDHSDERILRHIENLPHDSDIAGCRSALEAANDLINQRFLRGDSVIDLVYLRARLIDALLTQLWQRQHVMHANKLALVAVGGYGRGELHPYSDVDLMILAPDSLTTEAATTVAAFVALLWDIGLEIGHSVRSVEDCVRQSIADITIATTLIESRMIVGDKSLFDDMRRALSDADVWPGEQFYRAKLEEQRVRHHRYHDTAYKLEPNVKRSPGGLRDYQMIGWLAKHHLGIRTLDELVALDFLSTGQRRLLHDCVAFLWRVRFGLHILSGRGEDRLLFDHQSRLAEMLGYEDQANTLAVEQMMQRYYRTVMDLSRLNEMLLQLFEESVCDISDSPVEPIDERFSIRNGYLQTANAQVFEQDPSALLELFLLLQKNSHIRGVSAHTIRLVRRNLHLIDDEFRQNQRNHKLFMEIIRAPEGVTHELRRMNHYGVLGLYIPAFGKIVGRMQYDLFHAYTVDEHTLFVVSNLRRFALQRFDQEYPHCSFLMQSFEQPEIVYLAGLFHDIAKGRGGDHSELGAVDAEEFCLSHGLGHYNARTVAWLVRNHLALSMTAQKKDLGDPSVINDFAALVGDKTHLDYLYVLTVADVRGTNPKLWNSWKATLFRDLYEKTARALRQGLENPIDRELLIQETRDAARELLKERGLTDGEIEHLWRGVDADYFLRYRSNEISWHAQFLSQHDSAQGFVSVRKQAGGDGLEAALFTPRKQWSFARTTAMLDQLGMNIVDVRIVPINAEYRIDTYIFLELDQRTEVDNDRLMKVERALSKVVGQEEQSELQVTRPAPRQVRMFKTKTHIEFSQDTAQQRTKMELVARDRPGLLGIVGQTFIDLEINIETAKILTIGERAEDVFYILNGIGEPLRDDQCAELRETLIRRIDEQPGQEN